MLFDDGMTHLRHGAEPLSTRARHSHLVHGLRKGVIARRSGSRLSTLSGSTRPTDNSLLLLLDCPRGPPYARAPGLRSLIMVSAPGRDCPVQPAARLAGRKPDDPIKVCKGRGAPVPAELASKCWARGSTSSSSSRSCAAGPRRRPTPPQSNTSKAFITH